MRVLTTAAEVSAELARLLRACSSCQVAVAWASVGFKAFDLLTKNAKKIERMVVGTHFYQTHPDFIERFLSHPNVRFVLNPDGVFHPKVYLFEKSGGAWECVIGSPNFTQSGFGPNDEMAVLVTNDDQGAQEALHGVRTAINGYWHKGASLSPAKCEAYREAWNRKRAVVKNLRGKFGDPQDEDADDHGKAPLDVTILGESWAAYYQKVKDEKPTAWGHSMSQRLKVIQTAKQLFADHERFGLIDREGRRKIGGLVVEDGVDYRFFGSMVGNGMFKKAINNNDENLSLALDLIPAVGSISRRMYLKYIERYKKAFPKGRHGIATATRLLAMKRPDTFVCFDKLNRESLCKDFGISQNVGYEEYWDSIIERIVKEASWWSAPAPPPGGERDVWEARAAFLDSIYYDRSDLASP
jgi:HKD family nuclease